MKIQLFDFVSVITLALAAVILGLFMLFVGILFQLFSFLERNKKYILSMKEKNVKNLFPAISLEIK